MPTLSQNITITDILTNNKLNNSAYLHQGTKIVTRTPLLP